MNITSEESHILDEIPIYLTDGLNAVERKQFESHVADCSSCAAAMFDAKTMDDSLCAMFEDVAPDRGFEHRLIARFRQKTAFRRLHPMVRRAAIGVAATIVVGSGGYFFVQNRPQLERVREASNLKQMGLAMSLYSSDIGAGQAFSQMTRDERVAHNAVAIAAPTFSLAGRTITEHDATVSAGLLDTVRVPQLPGTRDRTDASAGSLVLHGEHSYSGGTAVSGGELDAESGKVAPGGTEEKKLPFQGQNVVYGDGHVELQKSNWQSGFRGSVSGDSVKDVKRSNSPQDFYDSVLLPTVDDGSAIAPPTGNPNTIEKSRGNLGIIANGALANANPTNQQTDETLFRELQSAAAAPVDGPVASAEPVRSTPPSSSPDAAPSASATATQPSAPDANAAFFRKIIREGALVFEIDSFDSTVMTIGKIVAEEGGFVSTTDSDKLANGKVQGTVVVRVPPENLDTLVLKLRGIGDLKSQKITAQDITKQYTDLESELRAAQAMQDRLLEIIKNGKGPVKDLLEAEKQLGVWREKIEQVEGELRYDNNLVSLSTLSITLTERDIKSAAFSSVNEQVTMALETEKVEEAYNTVRDAIDNAKGRIIASELKQFNAGQFGATIKAQLPPDVAEGVIGRIRQLDGRIANFQRERSQSDEGGSAAPLDASKVKHEQVTLSLSIYNLANIAPRRTTALTLAASSVEDAYASILDQAAKAGARVVASDLNRSHPDQSTGTITLNAPSEKADALLAALHGDGEMLAQENSDNPDTQNVTSAKRGLVVQLVSVASVAARQSETLQLASADVPGAFAAILDALRSADARIIASQLNQQDAANKTATIAFDISRTARPPVDACFDKVGEIISRNIVRSQDTANTLDSKIHMEMTLQSADVLSPRQTTTLGMEVADVQKSVDDLINAVAALGGREIDKDVSQDQNGRSVAHLIVQVPLEKADSLSERIESVGHRRTKQMTRDPQAPQGRLAWGRLDVTFADAAASLGGQETTWDAIRNGLSVSGEGLRWSAQMIVVGLCFVAPWAMAIWIGWRVIQRVKRRPAPDAPSKPA